MRLKSLATFFFLLCFSGTLVPLGSTTTGFATITQIRNVGGTVRVYMSDTSDNVCMPTAGEGTFYIAEGGGLSDTQFSIRVANLYAAFYSGTTVRIVGDGVPANCAGTFEQIEAIRVFE